MGREHPARRARRRTEHRAEHDVCQPGEQDQHGAVDRTGHQRADHGADGQVDDSEHERACDHPAGIVDAGPQRQGNQGGGGGDHCEPQAGERTRDGELPAGQPG
jgi:hypothetical protein